MKGDFFENKDNNINSYSQYLFLSNILFDKMII